MAREPVRAAWDNVVNAIQAWIDVMPDAEALPPVFHCLLVFEDKDTGETLRYYPLRMAQGIGIPMEPLPAGSVMGEIASYQPMVLPPDTPPINTQNLVTYLENAMFVRIHLAQSMTVQDPQSSGAQLAMANIFYALLEKIGMRWFDTVEEQGEEVSGEDGPRTG